jgi:hypothetical protein
MPPSPEFDPLKPYLDTVLDLRAEGMDVSWIREFLETEHGVWVKDDVWAAFLRRHVPGYEAVTRLQEGAGALSKAPKETVYTRLAVALAAAHARRAQDVQTRRARCADTRRAVHTVSAERARWRRMALVLAVFAGSLCGTIVTWLLRG